MKIGFSIPSVVGGWVDSAALARAGEEMGFESIWISEHAFLPVSTTSAHPSRADGTYPESIGHMMDPFVSLARASAVTTSLKLGTGIVIVPQRSPLMLAKEVATLDLQSGGRFLFGIGAGIFREEIELVGGDFDHRWAQTRESVEAMKLLWTEDHAEYHGTYYDCPPVLVHPKPAQKPHPPIILGGGGDAQGTPPDTVLRRVARWGDGWLPHVASPQVLKESRARLDRLAEAAGRDPRSIEISMFGQGPDPDTVSKLEEAGADRVVVGIRGVGSTGEAVSRLEEMARLLFR